MIKQGWYRWQRRRSLPTALESYRCALPSLHIPLNQLPLLALDMELTALPEENGEIIALGLVPIDNLTIQLQQVRYWLIKPQQHVGDSMRIHGLSNHHLQQAPPLEVLLPEWLALAQGRCLLAHHCPIEFTLLKRVFTQYYHCRLPLPFIDTQHWEQYQHHQGEHRLTQEQLRLGSCRQRYQLPPYRGHHALNDALSCAELFLAQHAREPTRPWSALLNRS